MENKLYGGLTIFPKPYMCCEARENSGSGGSSGGGVVTCNLATPSKENTINDMAGLSISYSNATLIGVDAFSGCQGLISMHLPKAITISKGAFQSCISLKQIDLPNADTISDQAFQNCASLTRADLPNATYLGAHVFQECGALTNIDLPKAMYIHKSAFHACSSLTSIDLPKAIYIYENAFYDCTSLDTLILSNTETVCELDLTAILGTKIATENGEPTGEGFIYVPSKFYDEYHTNFCEQTYAFLVGSGYSEEEAEYMAPYIVTAILRKIEDYPEICCNN